jgi:hypothetical protein
MNFPPPSTPTLAFLKSLNIKLTIINQIRIQEINPNKIAEIKYLELNSYED